MRKSPRRLPLPGPMVAKAARRLPWGGREDENARRMPLCLWVLELYRSWGEGCHQTGWAQVLNQLMCDELARRRIERYL